MKNKPGFHATLIVIIVLAIGLAGAVGYIFWNNMNSVNNSNTNNSNSNNSGSSNQTVTLKDFSSDSQLGYNLSLKYPSDWKLNASFNSSSKSQNVVLTSPKTNVVVKVNAGYMPLTGANCDNTDSAGKLVSFNYKEIAGLKDLVLLDEVYTKNNLVNYARTGVTYKNGVSAMAVGQDLLTCTLERIREPQFIKLYPEYNPSTNQTYGYAVLNQAKIILLDLQDTDGGINPNVKVSDIESARSSVEYKQAVDILLSTTYSKP